MLVGTTLWSVENRAEAAGPTDEEQQLIHTPKIGSLERKAICDAARPYVLSNYAIAAPPQPIVFRISHISVQEPYCNFEAIPLYKDGSYISTEYVEDIGFNFCLKETAGTWEVIMDLSRTDVPDTSELRKIRDNFPRDFPLSLLSSDWRERLERIPSSGGVLGSQKGNELETAGAAKVIAAREADWAAAGISEDFVVASKMAKSGSTAREINEEIALEHRDQPDRPQMHAAERAELSKYYGVVIDGL